jgi:hypothetical protein
LIKEKFILQLSDVDFNKINASINTRFSKLDKVNQRELLLDKRSEWIEWISEHHNQVNEYQGITKDKRYYISKLIKLRSTTYMRTNNIDIHYRYPLVNDGI